MKRDAITGFDEQDREKTILRSVYGSKTKIARVLPFKNQSLMPSLGTRRSTRVFVPKSVKIGGSESDVKLLRSGKKLLPESGLKLAGKYGGDGVGLDENDEDWFKFAKSSPEKVGDGGKKVRADGEISAGKGGADRNRSDLPLWRSFVPAENRSNPADSGSANSGDRDQTLPESCRKISGSVGKGMDFDNQEENAVLISNGKDKLYGITYSRKRRWIPARNRSETGAIKDRMYGISFVRRKRRKNSGAAPEPSRETQILERISSSNGAVDNSNGECVLASSNSNFSPCVVNQVTLVISVESSRSSSYYFLIFLVSILSWMRCSPPRMFNLAAFLFLESIATVFSQQGIQFLPLLRPEKFDKNKLVHFPHSFSNLEEKAVDDNHCGDEGVRFLKPNSVHSGNFPGDIFSLDMAQHLGGPGIGVIFGANRFIPLVSVNFAALPSYFMGLHSKMFLSSQYLQFHGHGFIGHGEESYLRCTSDDAFIDDRGSLESWCQESFAPTENGLSVKQIGNSVCPAPKRRKIGLSIRASGMNTRLSIRKGGFGRNPRVWKPPKKRNQRGSTKSSGPSRMDVVGEVGRLPPVSQARQERFSMDRVNGLPHSESNGFAETSVSEINGVGYEKGNLNNFSTKFALKKVNSSCKISNSCDQLLETYGDAFADIGADGVEGSPDSNRKPRKSMRKSASEKMKEMKLALAAELKQNIDSVCCNANILVIEPDRCWRVRGAEVVLESSDSNDCLLAVKIGGMPRYFYKAQEMRPSASNRYTHAMMWAGESGWKLEFCDRKDWIVFKELHRECCDRNLQAAPAKVIPVPGIWEVCDYECSSSVPFVRPSVYITTEDDEVGRALMSDSANYDMDSGDEEWLKQMNSSSCDSGNDGPDYISEENFEKIIYTLEKASYNHPDDLNEDIVASLCMGLGGKKMITAVYEYWLRKRKQQRKALVRVFQGSPPKRAQLIEKPFLRKKRSFKRKAIKFKKGKPNGFLAASAAQEAVCQIEEAKKAAAEAVERAMIKRRTAQLLMQNADLMTYKSVMALKVAEAIGETQ